MLVATVVALSARAADDVLELFDTLMTTELLSKAERESANEKLRRYPRVSCNAGKLAAAVKLLLALDLDAGLAAVWELIENEVPKQELRAAVAAIDELGPPTDAELDGQRMEELAGRLATVRPFLPLLMETVEFGATGDGVAVLAAMRTLATLLTVKSKLPASYLDARQVNHDLITGGWQRLVYAPGRPAGTVDRAAVRGLPAGAVPPAHQASQHLRHRVVSLARPARSSAVRRGVGDRPRAGDERARPARQPAPMLVGHAAPLDAAYREVASRLDADTPATVDAEGRLHVAALSAVPDPASLVDLRRRVEAMLPRFDLPELVLEVMSWHPQFVEAFTHTSGNEARVADLGLSVAAVLCAHAMNVGFAPVTTPSAEALTRDRLHHVDRYPLLPRHRVRPAAPARPPAPAPAGQPARSAVVAHQPGRRLRPAGPRRPRPHRRRPDHPALGGHVPGRGVDPLR